MKDERRFFSWARKHSEEPSHAGFGRIFTVIRCQDEGQVLHRKAKREMRAIP